MRELGFNPDETLAEDLRSRSRRGAARSARHAVRLGLRGRHDPLHHDAAERVPGIDLRAHRGLLHRIRQPSGEVGIAHGGPIIDGVLGYRASIWYRYDGGWIDRVDNADHITERNANYAGTTAARFALLWQPNDNVKVTPSFMFQNKQQHDLSTYWPRVFRSGRGPLQQRDARAHSDSRCVLPAGAQGAGRLRAHDASSRTARTTIATRPTPTRGRRSTSPTFRRSAGRTRCIRVLRPRLRPGLARPATGPAPGIR